MTGRGARRCREATTARGCVLSGCAADTLVGLAESMPGTAAAGVAGSLRVQRHLGLHIARGAECHLNRARIRSDEPDVPARLRPRALEISRRARPARLRWPALHALSALRLRPRARGR